LGMFGERGSLMSKINKLFKPRMLAKTVDSKSKKLRWMGSKIWQEAYKDPSMFKIPKVYDARGLIGYWDNNNKDHNYMFDYQKQSSINNYLGNSPFLKKGVSSFPTLVSLGYDVKHTCSECNDTEIRPQCECGAGNINCDACGAEGGFNCDNCNGDGWYDCDECDDGYVDCNNCGANGEIDCDNCGGEGTYECKDCVKEGCTACEGTGILKKEGEAIEDLYCEECLGSGTKYCDYADCNEGIKTCAICEGGGVVQCDDCNGDMRVSCDYCEDGQQACDDCYDGLIECGDCGGNGYWVCQGCNGDWEGGQCKSYSIPHKNDANWEAHDYIRRQSIIKCNPNSVIGKTISKNFLKHIFFQTYDSNKLFGSALDKKKDRPYVHTISNYVEKLGVGGRQEIKLKSNELEELEREFDKITNKKGFGIHSKVIIHNLPYLDSRGFMSRGRYHYDIYNDKSHFLLHESWDNYLSFLKMKVKKFQPNIDIDLFNYNYDSFTFVYIAGDLHHTRQGSMTNPSGTLLVVPNKGFKDWKLKALEDDLVDSQKFYNNQPYSLRAYYPSNDRTDDGNKHYQGNMIHYTINIGAAVKKQTGAEHWSSFRDNKWNKYLTPILTGKNKRKSVRNRDPYYDLDERKMKNTQYNYYPKGFPNSVAGYKITMLTTNLKFNDYSFMNWVGENPLYELMKK